MIGALGHPTALTPTLDHLIGNGVAYTNAYAPTPSCIPARREIMTGTTARTHGDRTFQEMLPMPNIPSMAQTFRDNGYQAYGVGKLHAYPQRDRIGFDDVKLSEQGRQQFGMGKDDYELFLHEEGFSGQEYTHGVSSNDYMTGTWHLPEHLHEINWTAREMSKYIARRDPRKPGFWYMSFLSPHQPLTPLPTYMDIYRSLDVDMPFYGDWSEDVDTWPHALRARRYGKSSYSETAIRDARRAFYALATHIDYQIRLVIGLLREENLLNNTAIMFTSDHGNMLGNHGLYDINLYYESVAKIPLILMPPAGRDDIGQGLHDDRLAVHADILPTLADICGIPIPDTVEGNSLIRDVKRDYIYGEHGEGVMATRMIRDDRYKLIYYPAGDVFHLFDLQEDAKEMRELSDDPAHANVKDRLTALLIENLYGSDLGWLEDGKLVGLREPEPRVEHPVPSRAFGNQRGWRFGHKGPASNKPSWM